MSSRLFTDKWAELVLIRTLVLNQRAVFFQVNEKLLALIDLFPLEDKAGGRRRVLNVTRQQLKGGCRQGAAFPDEHNPTLGKHGQRLGRLGDLLSFCLTSVKDGQIEFTKVG